MKKLFSLLLRPLASLKRRSRCPLHTQPTSEWQQAEQEFKRLLFTIPDPGPFDLNQVEHLCLMTGRCPDCNSDDLRAGPQGGCSQNVMCGDCTSEFNVSPVMSERLSPAGKGIRTRMYGVFKA